jgi:hypothetical protein
LRGGEIGTEGERAAADFSRQLLRGDFAFDVVHGHTGARLTEPARDGSADTAARASNQHCLTRKIDVQGRLLRKR